MSTPRKGSLRSRFRVGRMNEVRCEGILFDCDGVLVDSAASVLNAWTRWAADLGLDADLVTATVHGRRSADTVAEFVPAPDRAAAVTRIDTYEVDDADSVTAIAGAAALLATIPRDRWAVVTSGNFELATARLRAAGLPEPAVLVTAGDVANGKPHPEGYLAAAHRLGVDPADTVVVEDAQSGVDAARAAGAGAVVGVGPSETLSADVVVADLTALRWTGRGLALVDR